MGASPAPYIPGPVPIYSFTLTWPLLTENIKDNQMKKKNLSNYDEYRTILEHEGWESEAMHFYKNKKLFCKIQIQMACMLWG